MQLEVRMRTHNSIWRCHRCQGWYGVKSYADEKGVVRVSELNVVVSPTQIKVGGNGQAQIGMGPVMICDGCFVLMGLSEVPPVTIHTPTLRDREILEKNGRK